MKTSEIRQSFLQYFESKGHSAVQSSSLIPAGDPTLLFVNAGMVQFKDCFLGTEKRGYTRATSCQKCLRISGKHNDLENVGRTARHHTFFEMLGNFSFGDYFKPDAIEFAWEFLTETMALPKERLWVTVFDDDDEAEELWKKVTDVDPARILRCGEKDNFWAMGETGPCGPCTEIHYFLGDDLASQCEEDFRKDDGTYLEIWNLVFMQYNRDASGKMEPLPKPSVDTGMGLERIAQVKQGVFANYDTDELRQLIALAEKMSGKSYLGKDYTPRDAKADPQYEIDTALRVIADHSRACSFLISDGVNPGSDGRGYVLRRLIRRACRHGRNLGFKEAFLFKVCEEVISIMGAQYPELKANAEKISKLTRLEEEKFIETIDGGMTILSKEVRKAQENSSKVLAGDIAFQLHDTYGFPLDLTEDILKNDGLSVDRVGFTAAMDAQRERSRAARSNSTELILQKAVKALPTEFVGYTSNEFESSVSGLFVESGEMEVVKEGDEVAVVVAQTPFYAESGGQVGDTGSIASNNASLEVIDTQKAGGDTIVHICRVKDGELKKNDGVRMAVDAERRQLLRLNHSATHLLHLALREVLGDHVKQAGSRVSENTLRFDFSHYEAITPTQIEEIEAIVNAEIRGNAEVETVLMNVEEAKASGAMALFGEKYGDSVRVVQIGDRSRELCGGTHCSRAGDIGFMSVIAEGGVAAGVRRVEAVSGPGAFTRLANQKRLLASLNSTLRSSNEDLLSRVEKLVEQNKDLEKSLNKFQQQASASASGSLTDQAKVLDNGTRIVVSKVDNASPKQLREMADDIKQRLGSGCIALASVSEEKAILLTAVTEDLTKQFHAGKLIGEIAKVVGSKGGGRADLAQAGGGDPSKLDEALTRFEELVS